ncbi:MAG: hypothetical protein WBL63_23205 [Candidatus Acidiferrum sp.]
MHHHYCDFAGHRWECTSPECECFDHNVSMENGDHSQCRIELRACPEHEAEQQQSIAEAMDSEPDPALVEKWQDRPHCECECAESQMGKIVGWCMWCDHTYARYNSEIEDRHFAYDCPGAPEELRQSARARFVKN